VRNAATWRHFAGGPLQYALEADWLAGAAGFEPLRRGINFASLSESLWCPDSSRSCLRRFKEPPGAAACTASNLTAAGRAFLDHARLALTQAEAAAEAARRAAQPVKPTFAMGFQTGQEVNWLPRATSVLRDELLNIEIRVSSDHSTTLADDLQRGKLDIAFLRREQKPDLEYKIVAKEPLVVILPSDHPLAEHKAIDPHDLVGETYIGISEIPRVLHAVINAYLKRTGIELTPHLEIDNFAMAISLVASTRGVALLPASAENFLTWSVVSRPLKGETPTIDLVIGYHRANTSPILRTFLSRIVDITARMSSKRDR
jgi:LysR family transcriptional regulator, hca operon transcriptional activator